MVSLEWGVDVFISPFFKWVPFPYEISSFLINLLQILLIKSDRGVFLLPNFVYLLLIESIVLVYSFFISFFMLFKIFIWQVAL